jgi:DNA-binding NarL/FixJ family response regulator
MQLQGAAEPGSVTAVPVPIRIAIIEDQRPMRETLAALIASAPDLDLVGRYASMEDALPALERLAPDVVLADIKLPGMSGIDGVRRLKAFHPAAQVLMLTVFADNDKVFEAICAGASGYLLKDTPRDKLLAAIRELAAGGAPMSAGIARKVVTMFQHLAPVKREGPELSEREIEVLRLLADGHVYKTAADTLGISADTVRFHVRNIYEKLHVHTKSEAVQKAFRHGILR